MRRKRFQRLFLPTEIRSERELRWGVVRLVLSIVVVADLIDASINLAVEPERLLISFVQTTLIAGAMAGIFGTMQYRSNLALFRTKFQFEILSRLDQQTGLLNRRTFMESSEALLDRGVRAVLIVADIDRFKSINDTYGHPIGDVVIAGVGSALAAAFPEPHLTGRLGGEEFAVLFITEDAEEARREADAFRRRLETLRFMPEAPDRAATVSAGFAEARPGRSFADLYAAADAALYAAKLSGRNAVAGEADADAARLAELAGRTRAHTARRA